MVDASVTPTPCKPQGKSSYTVSGTEATRIEKIPKHRRDYPSKETYLQLPKNRQVFSATCTKEYFIGQKNQCTTTKFYT
jgi:hypothetical protein